MINDQMIENRSVMTAGSQSKTRPFVVIRPNRGFLDLQLEAIWAYRDLLGVLIARDIKVLYRQAIFGIAWAILQPVFTVAIFTVVFSHIAKLQSDFIPYPLFALCAVLPWTYFSEALRRSATGLVQEAELVRKVYFPRLVILLAAATAPMVDFLVGCVLLFVVMVYYGIAPTWHIFAIFPLLVLTQLLALSVSFWLGPLNVRFRDVKHTLPFVIQIWMYASPIFYPASLIPDAYRWLYDLNPAVGIIEAFRWAVLGTSFNTSALAISIVCILMLLISGLIFFRQQERHFADLI